MPAPIIDRGIMAMIPNIILLLKVVSGMDATMKLKIPCSIITPTRITE